MTDLSFVQTADLIDELFRRTDTAVVVTVSDLDGKRGDIRSAVHGNYLTAIGLCTLMASRLGARLDAQKEF